MDNKNIKENENDDKNDVLIQKKKKMGKKKVCVSGNQKGKQ